MENIEQAVQDGEKIKAAIKDATKVPDVPLPPSDLVKLDGGLVFDIDDEEVEIRTAVVRELTGEHEEALARALKSGNTFHFMNVLLESGVASLGDITDPATVKKVLRKVLIGDRDALALAIRVATYGSELEVLQWQCPSCGATSDMVFDLTEGGLDIKRRTLSSVRDNTFEVPLRKGGKARVRLATGADQLYVYEDTDFTSAERHSRLLSKCVETITDAKGQAHNLILEPSYVLKLSIPDRTTILAELSKRQPGPQYTEIEFRHEDCGNEVTISLGLIDLFRDLLLFL